MTRMLTKLFVGAFTGVALLTLPAIGAPIAPQGLLAGQAVNNQVIDVRAARGGGGRGGYRGGSAHRGAAVHRGGVAYRGGAVVRRGAVVGGATYGAGYYGGSSCDPNYQDCGGGYYSGGVYRSGAVVRGGAVYRGGAAYRGAHVAHRGGGARVARAGGGRRR